MHTAVFRVLFLSAIHNRAILTEPDAVCCDVSRDKQKGEALGELFTRINESLESTGSFPPLAGEQGSEAQPRAQGQAHVWTMFQLAQHYDMQGRTGGLLFLDTQTVTNITAGDVTMVKSAHVLSNFAMSTHMVLPCHMVRSSCHKCI